ncbi:MAG: selenide, water dikinase, partial [candidate division Zixibacteria bacterium SM23_73_2]
MQVLHHLNKFDDPNILIGFNSIDDAGVYKLTDDLALVQTVDFFPPIVDDPYDFGAVACANSLSDVYAMGGKPISALNLVGFPSNKLPLKVLEEILKGGADKAKEAGVSIIGGHTIKTKEPLYGLSVTGVVHPQKIIKNSGAEKGDLLILTKPLGSGIITTALKQGKTNEELEDKVTGIMAALNKSACEAMVEVGIKAATDITGFGLLGHLWEVCSSSGVGAEIYLSRIPTIKEVWDLAAQKCIPGGTLANLKFSEDKVVWEERIDQVAKFVLADAQTSGGLLIFCPQEKKDKL